MKRFKSAFTLPEVLLSLSIIGIIAAITIPQVYVAVKDAQNKATLGRANEQIELGMQNIIQDYNLKHPGAPAIMTLSEAFADLDDEEKFKLIALHLGLASDKDSHIVSILNSMLMPAAYAGWFNLNVYDAPDNGAPDNTVDSATSKEHCTMHPDDYAVCGGGGGGGSSSSDLNAPDQDKDAGDGDVVPEICDNGATPEYDSKTGEYTCPETPNQLPKPLCAEDEILKYNPATGLYTCTKLIPVIPLDPDPVPPEPDPEPTPEPDPVPVGTIKSFKLNKTSATVHFMEQINKEAVAPKDKISSIIIDTNGKAKPNTVGKDQFKYVLLNNGKLVPQE